MAGNSDSVLLPVGKRWTNNDINNNKKWTNNAYVYVLLRSHRIIWDRVIQIRSRMGLLVLALLVPAMRKQQTMHNDYFRYQK